MTSRPKERSLKLFLEIFALPLFLSRRVTSSCGCRIIVLTLQVVADRIRYDLSPAIIVFHLHIAPNVTVTNTDRTQVVLQL